VSALTFKGVWDASTGSAPAEQKDVGSGHYWIVNTAGTTSVNSINDWEVGDWIIYVDNVESWQKIDNTDKVSSVASKTGVVTLQIQDLTDVFVGTKLQLPNTTTPALFIEGTTGIVGINDNTAAAHLSVEPKDSNSTLPVLDIKSYRGTTKESSFKVMPGHAHEFASVKFRSFQKGTTTASGNQHTTAIEFQSATGGKTYPIELTVVSCNDTGTEKWQAYWKGSVILDDASGTTGSIQPIMSHGHLSKFTFSFIAPNLNIAWTHTGVSSTHTVDLLWNSSKNDSSDNVSFS